MKMKTVNRENHQDMRKYFFEIFDEYAQADTKDKRVALLRRYDSPSLRKLLRAAFHKNIHFMVERVPYYKPSILPVGMQDMTIQGEMRRLYLFEQGNPRNPPALTEKKRTNILIEMLENLPPREATVFMNMLLKNLRVANLDAELVREVFPDALADEKANPTG